MCLKGQRRSSNQKKRICSRISLHSRKKKHNHYAITKSCVCPSPRRERASESNKRKGPKVLLLPLTFHPRQYENNTKGIKHNQAPFPSHNSSSSQTKPSATRLKSSYYASCSQPKKSPTSSSQQACCARNRPLSSARLSEWKSACGGILAPALRTLLLILCWLSTLARKRKMGL